MASNPMQQFTVHRIGPEIKISGVDLSFTNASLFMVISASIILLFLFLGTKILKYLKPCFIKPITVTATKINKAIIKVTII